MNTREYKIKEREDTEWRTIANVLYNREQYKRKTLTAKQKKET